MFFSLYVTVFPLLELVKVRDKKPSASGYPISPEQECIDVWRKVFSTMSTFSTKETGMCPAITTNKRNYTAGFVSGDMFKVSLVVTVLNVEHVHILKYITNG